MARMARAVMAGVPHHVTQRGNRRQQVFFRDSDYREYLRLMGEWCAKLGVEVWAYCLMPNHVHLILTPETEDGLARALGEAHRRYTRRINSRENWRGYLWQGRFASYLMDEIYLMSCARYVEMNPVRAGLAKRAQEWKWSSARAHLAGKDDGLVKVRPLLDRVLYGWEDFLTLKVPRAEIELMKRHERTGRPLGAKDFIRDLELRLGRSLQAQKRGPKVEKKSV